MLINYSSLILTGTHDIIAAATILTENNTTKITTQYFEESSASGALYVLVFVTDGGAVDSARSVLLALDRETSRDYTLPFSLSPGGYRVFVYDIGQDGTLPIGVSYPAVTNKHNSQGSKTTREGIAITSVHA